MPPPIRHIPIELCSPNRAPMARPAVRGSEKATRALKISGAPFPKAKKVTPWGSMSRGFHADHSRHLVPPPPSTALFPQGAGSKDTATLWESLRLVEMADKLGQKLEEEDPTVRVCREGIPLVKCLRT